MPKLLMGAAAAIALLAVGLTSHVGATSASSTLPPVADIVIAIDQSSSMQSSDPGGLRVSLVDQVLRAAVDNHPGPQIRLGVVTFGSPHVSPPTGPNVLRLLAPIGETDIRPQTLDARQSLDGTDFISALCASWVLVTQRPVPSITGCDSMPAQPAATTTGPSLAVSRSVVLVTDGMPAPSGQDLRFDGRDSVNNCPVELSEGHNYLCDARRVWEELGRIEHVNLYVVGLSPSRVVDTYWRALTDCRTDARCRVAVRQAFDPESLARDLLDGAIVNLPTVCGADDQAPECSLPPWLSQVRFTVRGAADGTLRIVDAERRDRRAGARAVFTGEESDWWIQRPSKGRWRVEWAGPTRLGVSMLLTTQRFKVGVVGRPVAGDDVTLALIPEGPLQIDQATIVGEEIQVHTRRRSEAEATQSARVSELRNGQVIIANAVRGVGAGEWEVAVSARHGERAIFLGLGTFTVESAENPVVSAASVAGPSHESMSTACASGQTIEAVNTYEAALHFGYPLRFHDQRAVAIAAGGPCTVGVTPLTALDEPLWVTIELGSRIGYWLPLLLLLLSLGIPIAWWTRRRLTRRARTRAAEAIDQSRWI